MTRALAGDEGLAVVDTPPGDERIVRAALDRADAVVIPTRAGGVEYSRVVATLDMIGDRTPHGVVICAARLGTNDLDEAVAWWTDSKVPVWGIIPERVGIAAGPECSLYRGRPRGLRRGVEEGVKRPASARRGWPGDPAASGFEVAGPGRDVHGVLLERLERHGLQGRLMGRGQHHVAPPRRRSGPAASWWR